MPDSIIILRTDKPYLIEHETLLLNFCQQGISLFSVAGLYAEQWEDAMDDLIISEHEKFPGKFITTTNHTHEPWEEVLNMARHWNVDNGAPNIQIIEL
jgi:hypothetical protein